MIQAFRGVARLRWALTWVALVPGVVAAGRLAEPAAVIVVVSGHVDVTRSSGDRRTVFARALARGDRVAVSAGGSAILVFMDGTVAVLTEKSSLRIDKKVGETAGQAPGLPSGVFLPVWKFVGSGSFETGLIAMPPLSSVPDPRSSKGGAWAGTGANRGPVPKPRPVPAEEPFLTGPRQTELLTDRPTFTWRAVPGAKRYLVTVSSAERGGLWNREVEGLSLPFPAELASLPRAVEYRWEVDALSDAKSLRKESADFKVTSDEGARTVSANLARIRETAGGAESPAARFLAGSYLSGLGLFHDATEQFVAMCGVMPTSPAPHEALGAVYTEVGLVDLAAAELQQALALRRKP